MIRRELEEGKRSAAVGREAMLEARERAAAAAAATAREAEEANHRKVCISME